jgi:hypothetical protein
VVAALMTIYLVGTALTTVRPVSPWTRRINVAALLVAVGLALELAAGGIRIFQLPGRTHDGVPFFMPLFLATVLLLAAAGDVRTMRLGMPRGGPRLARHLWRMCFALFIAAGSFFSVRERVAKILPEPLTTGPMRALPILLLLAAMFYWLWRLRRRRPLPVVVRHEATPLTPAAYASASVAGSPNQGNSCGPKVTISAIRPSAMRSTSMASAPHSVSPARRTQAAIAGCRFARVIVQRIRPKLSDPKPLSTHSRIMASRPTQTPGWGGMRKIASSRINDVRPATFASSAAAT